MRIAGLFLNSSIGQKRITLEYMIHLVSS